MYGKLWNTEKSGATFKSYIYLILAIAIKINIPKRLKH